MSIYSFREALRQDPRFAEAHYLLADTYLGLGERGEVAPATALAEAAREAEAALALEEAPGSHLVLGSVRYYHDWDWAAARSHLEAALRESPTSDGVLLSYARYLSATGADDEAVRAIDRAEALTPGCDLVAYESGLVRFRARRYEEAIRKFTQASELGPPRGWDASDWRRLMRMLVLRVHARRGAWEEARQDATEILRLAGVPEDRRQGLARGPAREAVDRFLEGSLSYMARRSEQEYIPRVNFATVHALRGETERALDRLERAADEREPSLTYSLRDPDFDGLRDTPRFRALLARLRLPS